MNNIVKRMIDSVKNTFDKSEGSFFYDFFKPVAMEIEELDNKIEVVKSKLSIENLSGDELEERVYEKTGIKRKQATKATGQVITKGKAGTTINEGYMVASENVNFIIKETKEIDQNGQVVILVECEEAGTIGNVPENSITKFPIQLTDINSVTNPKTFENGYRAENDEELLERYYEYIKTPATSGNKYHYMKWAKEIDGVGDAKVFPLANGDNTVKVLIIGNDREPASDKLVNSVQDHIDPYTGVDEKGKKIGNGAGNGKAPIGAFCTVKSVEGVKINISLNPQKENNVDHEEMLKDIKANVRTYFREIAFNNNKVSYNKIASIILDSKGIVDFTNLIVNNSKGNILLKEEQVPVLGDVTID
ncbi:MAG: baseplate J/gp47 family protein [Anaeromicrobium sp.]|uniref:baseplate J/gp47 family protein n=1 Tax=Anaeromicrobium sp. TaxID=1929132 RepID=UPI0025F5DA31|nr:baseplate J/gp47 family protein [Anaeromicrobium sp.]MCT4593596.1 baseplate J/gp47 family protein [Anaeromicrobium sp.]